MDNIDDKTQHTTNANRINHIYILTFFFAMVLSMVPHGCIPLVGCHHHCPLVKPCEALHFSLNWFRLCGQWSWHSAFLLLLFSGSDLCSADVPPFFKGCYIHWSLVGFIFRTITGKMEDGRVEAMGKYGEISIFVLFFSEVLNSTSFFFFPHTKIVSCCFEDFLGGIYPTPVANAGA